MFADDLILIMEGPISEIDKKLIIIFKIIQEFGMNPNTEKTHKSKTLSKIKYLGICLEKEKHFKKNFEKVKDSFKTIKKIFSQQKLANGVKLQMFKSICISQLFYGLVIFNFNQKDFASVDVWINKKEGSTSILKLRNFTNYLNRYSYVYDKNKIKTKFCNLCKKHLNQEIIEGMDHFLWDCPFYRKNRKIWINELIQINKNNKQLKNNILDIIRNKDSLFILSLVNNKENYDSLLKFLNKNLEIRAVRGN
ncbi:hypothetical protein M0812_20715 [Anaeramoeba flamelloides]|uniref:Reverse transcriptase domain-containing protein n=1 Tax=Anaeramoeba flamelloides TaxID=1746091 RepID=A0AAV7YSJ7_9EUKA|nr:hypothetical protein M0812_20715 [Anaeramoeba flamelloides]